MSGGGVFSIRKELTPSLLHFCPNSPSPTDAQGKTQGYQHEASNWQETHSLGDVLF